MRSAPWLRNSFTAAFAISALGISTASLRADEPLLRLKSFAVNMGTGPAAASTVTIVIERWSTPAEREGLIKTFLEKGQDKLLEALQDVDPRKGYMRLPNSLGYDLKYAYKFAGEDGGERIILLTDRRVSTREAIANPRTMDYPFTLVEIHMNKDQVGVGKMSWATKITVNKKTNTVELENYGTEPIRLNDVKVDK